MDKQNKIVWVTDPHLNFCHEEKIKSFCRKIMSHDPSALVITGDISEAPDLEIHLRLVQMWTDSLPTYFVCGNHDYYHGSIKNVRAMLKKHFSNTSPAYTTQWLPNVGVVTLAPNVALVGHDGWYDGGYASAFGSKLQMSDFFSIRELSEGVSYDHTRRIEKMMELAKESGDYLAKYIPKALKHHDTVYVATHVAPFKEAARAPDGTMSDSTWMPYFSSRASGDAILGAMKDQPENKKCIVLCGHNHTEYDFWPTENIRCINATVRYKHPAVAKVFEL